MTRQKFLKAALSGSVCALALAAGAQGRTFDIPAGDLKGALNAYSAQSGIALIFSGDAVKGTRANSVKGDLQSEDALDHLLKGTGFGTRRDPSGAVGIVRDTSSIDQPEPMQLAQAAPRPSVETVTVTSSKLGGADVQSIPISITALSQEQLTSTQTAGGPDLVKQVPNLTFSKTNFTGYNIQIRGIGTQAISVTTDPAVAVAFNDIPFIRNHFFEQDFFDVSQVEVLRGPQGTLYGRNATAGVVNMTSAKPTDQYEAMGSIDVGNYENRRMEGMLNIPVIGDKLDIRLAGEWTKRDGYIYDTTLDKSVDGRDLWSGRVSVRFQPLEKLTADLVWEHFSENDDRLRSAKALCTRDPGPSSVDGPFGPVTNIDGAGKAILSQGCKEGSLYAPAAYTAPLGTTIPFVFAPEYVLGVMPFNFDPYGDRPQSQSLREIGSAYKPVYRAKNDTVEFNVNYDVTPSLTITSQTGYNKDSLFSREDYNRFDTVPGAFLPDGGPYGFAPVGHDGLFCDPQLGCSDRFLAVDQSSEKAEQFYQEVRLASNYEGPLNFSAGVSYLHYHTVEDYFVFANVLSMYTEIDNGVNSQMDGAVPTHHPFVAATANQCDPQPANPVGNGGFIGLGCTYIDPNPIDQIDGDGHNYFRSQNPYRLHSWAGFGEAYYQLTPEVKLTGGLRFTDDMKSFTEIPSWTFVMGKGYVVTGILDQEWKAWTGRFNATWTPKIDFTDQSLFYGSYARGYKGGGANPPGVIPIITIFGFELSSPSNDSHPLTFKPEYVDSFELGTKNTLLDGAMTLNSSVFYYKYQNYQISQIVDRTSVNLNFNATVRGAELEATWEPVPGLRFNFSGGYEDATLNNGSKAIDLMDRTGGHTDWMVIKPWLLETSNCILPTSVVNKILFNNRLYLGLGDSSHPNLASYDSGPIINACQQAYSRGLDPGMFNFVPLNTGFDPSTAPNHGAGFDKDLSGNKLPNTPPFTLSAGAQYSMPVSADWAATLRADGYWQGNSFARVYNDKPYDQLHGYTNVNLSLTFSNQDGWQTMAYVKNVFDTTAITGAFLNTDDTALTTNVFTTDPRLFGLRITKNW